MGLKKVTFSLVLVIAAVAAPSLFAWSDDATLATFKQPVQAPGLVLPAGEYLFKSLGPVVQIWDADRTTLYATLMTVPAYRRDADEKREFEFQDRVPGAPKSIKAWYYDGGSVGQEFVYPELTK